MCERKEAGSRKKYLFGTLVCLMLFSVCARPLPASAKSGSSTCQVTATAGETTPPSESGDGDNGEPEKPDPGDGAEKPDSGNGNFEEPDSEKEPSEEPDNPGDGDGTQPEEGDGEAEPGAPQATPEPGDMATEPDAPGALPGKGEVTGDGEGQETIPAESMEPSGEGGTAAGDDTDASQQPDTELSQTAETEKPDTQQQPDAEPSQTAEPGQTEASGEPGKHGGLLWQWVAALLMCCVLAVLAAAGVFQSIWTWLLFVFSRKSRRQFHGILTGKKNFFIHITDAKDSSRLVQEIIDGAGSLAECREEIMKETAVTEIPCQSRMRISYHGRDGMVRCREMAADEQGMFCFLKKLHGIGDVEVRITCRGTGIDISLHFCL